MKFEKSIVIVIPIYNENPTKFEKISLVRGLEIFNNPITFIYPKGMNLSYYTESVEKYALNKTVEFKEYPKKYFSSGIRYNELMLKESFYLQYLKYDYMLIYQLDAYMFDGDLTKIPCVDFIGAPCFEGFNHAIDTKYTGHQNGGLSMRNIKKSYDACKYAHSFKGTVILFKNKYIGKRNLIDIFLQKFGLRKNSCHPYGGEDMFFSFAASILVDDFNVASYEQSYMFAFDCLPQKLYELNGNKLPMGCHAYHKGYKWDFWKKYIMDD